MSETKQESTSNTRLESNGQNDAAAEKTEEKKDWMEYIQDLIKNPVSTGLTGLAAGYFIGSYVAKRDIETLQQEHKRQMEERDEQFKLLLKQIQTTNKLIASQQRIQLPDNDESLEMEQDKNTKVYHYKTKGKHFQLKA